jgi:hypothetical protein
MRSTEQARRPVELLNPVEVHARHRRASALELKCPEAIEGAHVEHPSPRYIGKAVPIDEGPQVEHALR